MKTAGSGDSRTEIPGGPGLNGFLRIRGTGDYIRLISYYRVLFSSGVRIGIRVRIRFNLLGVCTTLIMNVY